MPRNKTAGNDGLPAEFYLTFLDILGPILLKYINENFEKGILTCLQRQATVSLLEKSGKDNRLLKLWRPISLINVDAKILSKIFAGRLSRVLPKIISNNQYAFVKGRTTELRLLLHILKFTDQENVGGIPFAADYEAVFDSLDH